MYYLYYDHDQIELILSYAYAYIVHDIAAHVWH